MWKSWFFAAFLVAFGVCAFAAEAPGSAGSAAESTPESAPESAPESVIVSATRMPTPELQVASSVTVITADDIAARQQRSLPDILQDVPGLNIVRTGGPGGQTALFMRGTNSNHTKVLVDGIDVSDPSSTNAGFDFAQFLTQDIEKVEVLRGPQSGLYGSDAIGGVINIITKSGQGPAQLAAAVEGGSFETFNQSASASGSVDGFHYNANLEHFHSGATAVTPLDLLAPGERRNDDYYDNKTASTKLGYDVVGNLDLGLVARYTDTHLRSTSDDFSSFPSFPAAAQSRFMTTEYYTRATAHLLLFDGFLEQTLGFAYTRKRTSDLEPASPQILNTGSRGKLDWQGALQFSPAQTLVLGAEHARDAIGDSLAAADKIDSGYAELQSQWFAGLFSALNARYDKNALFGSKVTYRVAPTYVIAATGTKLKASVGSGFKAPTLSELYQDFPPFFFANPNLKPETSTGYDVGVEQPVAGGAARAGVTYFYNRMRNLITDNADFTSYANIGRAHSDGVESFAVYEPIKTLALRVDYTYTQATDDVLNQELLRRPRHKASLNASWHATRAFSANATVLTVSSWIDGNRDFSIPRLTANGYTVVNLAANFDVNSHLSIFGRIDNLSDRHFQNPVGFLQPTLGAFAGVRAKL
jgi:vitamin B12 transporter